MWGKEKRNKLHPTIYVNYLLYCERLTNYEEVRKEVLPYIKCCKIGAHCLVQY